MAAEAKVVDVSLVGALAFVEPRADEALLLLEGQDSTLRHSWITRWPALPGRRYFATRSGTGSCFRLRSWACRWTSGGWTWTLWPRWRSSCLKRISAPMTQPALHLTRAMGVPLLTFDERLARAWQELSSSRASRGRSRCRPCE